MGEEAEYLDSQSDDGASEDIRRHENERNEENLYQKTLRYVDNKRSEVGTTIRCANCGRRILKKSYQTQFCSNRGKRNCKDSYWNSTDEIRRERAIRFKR